MNDTRTYGHVELAVKKERRLMLVTSGIEIGAVLR